MVICSNPDATRRGNAGAYLAVSASAAKQSILSLCGAMDCFAELVIGKRFARSRWLAMTGLKLFLSLFEILIGGISAAVVAREGATMRIAVLILRMAHERRFGKVEPTKYGLKVWLRIEMPRLT
jgi:hypothetical protein